MLEIRQEMMTPGEAAKWFRRSQSWLRKQSDLVHTGRTGGQPLFHVLACRAFVLGKLQGLRGAELWQFQIDALRDSLGAAAHPTEEAQSRA